MKTYLVTGAAGFIGSNYIKYILSRHEDIRVVILDALTYAGNFETISKDIEVKIKNLTITKLKSVECTYEAQSTSISADDKVVYTVSSLAEGSGR